MNPPPKLHDDQRQRTALEQTLHNLVQHSEQRDMVARPPSRPLVWVAATLGAMTLAGATLWLRSEAPGSTPPASPAPVMPVGTDPGAAAGTLKMSGFFSAHELVQISATVLARVKAIRVSEGASVKKGELLVELSNIRGDNDVRSAQQHLSAAKLTSERAALDLSHALEEQQRQAALMAQGFGTRKAMAEADLRVKQARLELARSHSNTSDALANLDGFQQSQLEYAIRAPFSGVVVAQNARVGEVVSPTNGGSYIRSGLLALLNPATLEVQVSVQERLLPQLKSAGCALVSSLAQPDQIRAVPFQLGRISSTADRQRGAVNAVLVPLHPMRVLPILETSAEVQFVRAGDSRCSPPSTIANETP